MIILGNGIDIIEVDRIQNAISKNQRFLRRVFTDIEISYFASRKNKPSHIAGTFAAKEAVLKALGTGLRDIDWRDIEITRDVLGKPIVRLYENALSISQKIGIKYIHISISHGRDYAVAQAIAEGEKNEGCILGTDEKD